MKKFISGLWFLAIITTISCLWFFRTLPAGELWNGYSVLYVPESVPENYVLEELNVCGVEEVTCLSNQFLPLNLQADSCEVSLVSLNPQAMDYLSRKNNYFFDKSGKYRLYYVPVYYKTKLSQAVNNMNRKVTEGSCGVDSKSSYPFIFPVFVFIFAVLLVVFTGKKVLLGLLSILPFFYTISFPFLSSVIASLLVLIVLFLVCNIFGRRDFLKILKRKYVFMILTAFAVVSCFSSGFIAGFVFMLLILAEYGIFHFYRHVQIIRYKKSHFNPVMIRSSFAVKQYSGKESLIFGIMVLFTVLSFIFSVLINGNVSESNGKIAFPSVSASQKSEKLPDLKDYYAFDFSVRSFPYRSLNKEYSQTANISRFHGENGQIVQSSDFFEYSEAYEERVNSSIDLLQFNAFEKIMKKQGNLFSAGYASNGSHRLNLFCIIISFIQFSVLLIYFVWILINKKPKKGRGRR
ncbi:MAG: hypothetical protein MJ185_07935 [Treponema sp.]|nr:hypothetical protein [Treponema sp.]